MEQRLTGAARSPRFRHLRWGVLALLLAPLLAACDMGTRAEDIPSCYPEWRANGADGYVYMRQDGPGQKISWEVRAYDDEFNLYGQWVIDSYSHFTRAEHKDQNYNPHGTISQNYIKPGKLARVEGSVTIDSGPRSGQVGYFRGTCRQV